MTQQIVHVQQVENGIVQVTMQDRISKNTFTHELISGLMNAFESIREDSRCKVVILTGYDTYFACGGTQEALLAMHEGKARFNDNALCSLALDCRVPVIAAMQGHGIGGGFVFGLFADFVILARESVYTANFMRYGFTPGMGATCILPEKLGLSLAQEMLLNAGNYRGAELEKRGVPFPVVSRQEVLNHAHELARQLAEKPRVSLVTLKDRLVARLREQLPGVIEQEVRMHEKTFHQEEVKNRVMELFGK